MMNERVEKSFWIATGELFHVVRAFDVESLSNLHFKLGTNRFNHFPLALVKATQSNTQSQLIQPDIAGELINQCQKGIENLSAAPSTIWFRRSGGQLAAEIDKLNLIFNYFIDFIVAFFWVMNTNDSDG